MQNDNIDYAVFAGGCFWCIEAAFDLTDGVLEAVSGYSGGAFDDPSYEDVAYGKTDHFEAVRVKYDTTQISYDELLTIFWRNIDPLDAGGQFADRGDHYKTAIFVRDERQRELAQASLEHTQNMLEAEVKTRILPETGFYVAETHHQDYHKNNAVRYNLYKYGSGRVKRLQDLWGEHE